MDRDWILVLVLDLGLWIGCGRSDSESTITRVEYSPKPTSSKILSQSIPLQYHPVFYIDDGNVILRVSLALYPEAELI